MRNRIERLRLWLAVSAGLLLVVLVGFIGTARYFKRHALARLGSKLGIDIRSETNGFTYSQSLQGRTIYTIHAAKEIEHANGVIGLHDVSMIIYGRTGDRADMVYGNEFEYDKNAGEVRAIGLVHIDIGGAGSGTPGSAAAKLLAQGHDDPAEGPKLVHATTSGLVYLDKLGVAATNDPIEFQTGQMTGHAVGADYNTDTGILLLHSAVDITGVSDGRPVKITAAAAQLDNRGQRAVLSNAHCSSTDESLEASQLVLHTRPDTTLERVEADGRVRVQQHGAELDSAHAVLDLNTKSKPQRTTFTGGVRYTRNEPLRQARGEAQQVEVAFDSAGSPLHAFFKTGVYLIERTRASEDARQLWAVRDLTADEVETELTGTGKGGSDLREAEARGSAHVTMVDNGAGSSSPGRGTVELAGDVLTAHLLPALAAKQPARLDTVNAQGHTLVRQLSPEGLEQTSTGDTLGAQFRVVAPSPGRKSQPSSGAEELSSAVQTGHVHMTRKAPPKLPVRPGAAPIPEEVQDATAARLAYDGGTDMFTLTGAVRLQQTDSVLFTNQIVFNRLTGDAHAEGTVRVSYTQPTESPGAPSRDPVHVLADRADLKHATELATFFGHPVRLWQSGSQIQAPVVEVSRADHTLAAHAESQVRSSSAAPVQTVLVNASAHASAAAADALSGPSQKPGSAATSTPKAPQVVRVLSRELLYSEIDRKAQFNGPVMIESGGETIHARSATAYLEPAAQAATSKDSAAKPVAAVSLDGRLNRVVATGDVVIEQPGRRATGNRIVYLEQDSSVLLTGDRASPPHVVDTDRGTSVTAHAFRFHLGDDSIEALSSLPDDSAHQQVHTETPVRR